MCIRDRSSTNFALAGNRAAPVLGKVFTIKMVAYVGIAPIAGAFADRLPRRALLVTLDLENTVIPTLAALLLAGSRISAAMVSFGLRHTHLGAGVALNAFQARLIQTRCDNGCAHIGWSGTHAGKDIGDIKEMTAG